MNTTTYNPSTFKVGRKYFCRSLCDYDCVWVYEVIRRTAKTVTLRGERGEVISRKVGYSIIDKSEMVYPDGRYSMAPILSADKPC